MHFLVHRAPSPFPKSDLRVRRSTSPGTCEWGREGDVTAGAPVGKICVRIGPRVKKKRSHA